MAGTIPVTVLLEILAAKDAEIERLKKEKDDLAEKLRRSELDVENSARPSEPIEQIPDRNLDDVWTAINELKRRHNEPEAQNVEDPATSPSAKRIRLDPTQPEIDRGLQVKIESVQEQAQADINDLPNQDADINKRLETNTGNTILLIGGKKNNKDGAAPFVLSSDRSRWMEVKFNLPYMVNGSGVVYYNEELYLIGGCEDLCALYKLDKNMKWIQLADMNIGRYRIRNSCIACNGYIWVFGGVDEKGTRLKSVERYDVKKNKWTIMQDMSHARTDVYVTMWKDRIALTGCYVAGAEKRCSPDLFNPDDGRWTKLPNLPKYQTLHSLVSFKEKIIVIGGLNGKANCADVWELDPQKPNPTWSPLPPMNVPRNSFNGTVLDEKIFAIGGYYRDQVEIFDGEKWLDAAFLPYPTRYMSAVIIPQDLADRLCAQKS